jgi:hypothetical protein
MMPFRWSGSEFIWVWALALLIVLAGSIFYIYRSKRLQTFCNPELSGDRPRWYHQAVVILLLALGISSAAAIIPLSTNEGLRNIDSQPVIGILFDSDSVNETAVVPQGLSNWLEDSIQWIIENAPGDKISVWQTGAPAELLIPSTRDTAAIRLLAGVLITVQPASRNYSVPDGVASVVLGQRGSRSKIVVLSARTAPEIESLAQAVADSGNSVFFVHTAGNSISGPQFCYQNAAGKWVWESAAGRFREVLQNERQSENRINPWLMGMSVIQILALLAIVFLSAESMGHLLIYGN